MIGNREYKLIKITGVPLAITYHIFALGLHEGSLYTSHNVETGGSRFGRCGVSILCRVSSATVPVTFKQVTDQYTAQAPYVAQGVALVLKCG